MTWHAQLSFVLDHKWVAMEEDGDDLSAVMRKAETQAATTLGGEPQLIRMVATRLRALPA